MLKGKKNKEQRAAANREIQVARWQNKKRNKSDITYTQKFVRSGHFTSLSEKVTTQKLKQPLLIQFALLISTFQEVEDMS
jgi:hypothetical protein